MPLRQAEGALRVSCGRMADGQRERVRHLIASVLVLSRAMLVDEDWASTSSAFVNETRAVKNRRSLSPHSRSPCFASRFVRWNFLPTLFAA